VYRLATLFCILSVLWLTTGRVLATPTPSPSPEPAKVLVVPIPLSIVVDKAEAAQATLDRLQTEAGDNSEVDGIEGQAKELKGALHSFGVRVDRTLAEDATLDSIQALSCDLRALCEPVNGWMRVLSARSGMLEAHLNTLAGMKTAWEVTMNAAASDAGLADVKNQIAVVCQQVMEAAGQTEAAMRRVVSVQAQLAELKTLYEDLELRLAVGSTQAAHQLFERDSAPLWTADAYRTLKGPAEAAAAMGETGEKLARYFKARPQTILVHLCLLLVLLLLVSGAGRAFRGWGEQAGVTATPLATAYLMSFVPVVFMYPLPPRVLTYSLIISYVLAAVVILRPFVIPELRVGLYALVFTAFFDLMRGTLLSEVSLFRAILVIELVLSLAFVVWFLRSGRIAAARERSPSAARFARVAAWYLLLGMGASLATTAAGYASLSRYLVNLTVAPVYAGILIAASLRILDSFLIFFLRVPPLGRLGSVARNRDRLCGLLRYVFLFAGVVLWVRYVASQAPMFAVAHDRMGVLLNADLGFYGLTLSGIVGFVLAVTASFVISRVILVLLQEDVYPRVPLPNGVPYAISTMLHYVLVLLGFLVALSALGLDMTRFTVMVSAFGVGLGFGLQTIVNNVVSGVVLLFERPVKIGDVIEMNSNRGTLTHIGLRASVLHASDGSDIILPNGTLLSSNVVNYTFTDQKRRIDIDVHIPAGHDAEAVMKKLVEQVRDVDHILEDPAPECLFVKFTDKEIALQVRAWVGSRENWRRVRSALNLAVYGMLLKDGLVSALPTPPAEQLISEN